METTESVFTLKSLFDKGKLFLKAVIIFFMAIALWIPTAFIQDLVKERQNREKEAKADINSKWGTSQTVTGPLLAIPYNQLMAGEKGQNFYMKQIAWFIPSAVESKATIIPEKRHRGIYDVVVYRSDISIRGKFDPLNWQQLNISAADLKFDEAALVFKVSDNQRGINEDLVVQWESQRYNFNPQAPGFTSLPDAFTATIPLTAEEALKEHHFSMNFSLNGSQQLLFAATARENKLQMESSWPDPSFTGIKLPDTRIVKDSGFMASWKYLNRSLPTAWKSDVSVLNQTLFGTDLEITVDSYDKTLRSVKYALLCIVLTFASFFLIESIYNRPLHLLQYGLAGLALVLFYTLLLSISEYISFNNAYLIAAVATIALVAWYIGSILRSGKLAMFICLVLSVVYGYIFSIIQLQDYALLMGSIGLFLALAIIMYFSRKLKWS
jgi:inner membrane protein